jgi:hypothetical protein
VPFVIMGIGMALTMSPMSTAAMNAVDVSKAGVASGVLSMSRMVGGTFGVAAIGALFQSLSTSRFQELVSGLDVSDAKRAQLEDALGSGSARDALKGLDPQTAQQAADAMRESFVHALSGSLKLSTAVAAAGAVIALVLIERKPARRHDPAIDPQAAAEEAAAEPARA